MPQNVDRGMSNQVLMRTPIAVSRNSILSRTNINNKTKIECPSNKIGLGKPSKKKRK
jgi:hypothetical protein